MKTRGDDAGSAGGDPGGESGGMLPVKWILKPGAWLLYFVIVFEILFMISPLALHFYSAYGPALNFLHQRPATSWLTSFYLPHFSRTGSPVLDSLRGVAFKLILIGGLLFFACAIPLYASKLLRRAAVTGGFYRFIRHPQYAALAIVGLGTCLLWPRFLVAIGFVTMVLLYVLLARWEEQLCVARYGDSYRTYMERTGMFLPRWLERMFPRVLPAGGGKRALAIFGLYGALMAATVGGTFALQDYSLSRVSAFYTEETAVLSPARLDDKELKAAYGVAVSDPGVVQRRRAGGPGKWIVYVVPLEWRLPDLPMDAGQHHGGHRTPADFDRTRYKVLFTRTLTHAPEAGGRKIVTSAYGRDPVVLVKVDISKGEVMGTEEPPSHVRWGDIPTPMF